MLTDLTDSQVRVHCRWLIRMDLPSVLWIDSGSFAEPWAEQDFVAFLQKRDQVGQVAEIGEQVVGYFIYRLHHDHLHLIRLAVSPERRRQGIGCQMLAKLCSKLHRNPGTGRDHLTIDVPEALLEAQIWLRSIGVRAVSVDRDAGTYRFEWRKDHA